MVREERYRRIIDWLKGESSLNISELKDRLNVSTMTIWRDLNYLEEKGLIQRVRGGAMKKEDDNDPEPFFDYKQQLFNEQKRVIARYAAGRFVQDNQIIILEGGTTVAGMVPFLDQTNLTLMTNGLDTLVRASKKLPDLNLMCCGGIMREKSRTFVGPQAEAFFADFHAHIFFLGATGISLETGITDPSPLEIQVKRAMSRCAEKTVLLLDSSKFNVRSLSQIIPLQEIDALVTDRDAPRQVIDQLCDFGIDIHIAENDELCVNPPVAQND